MSYEIVLRPNHTQDNSQGITLCCPNTGFKAVPGGQNESQLRTIVGASQVVLLVKNPPINVGDIRDAGLIPVSGRSPEGSHGNPLQHSCLENPMDRGAWPATIHRVSESDTTAAA